MRQRFAPSAPGSVEPSTTRAELSSSVHAESSPEPCTFPWVRDLPPVTRADLRIGPAVFRWLGRGGPAWRFEPARVLARHLRRGDEPELNPSDARDLADEALANGPDLFAAMDVLVDVPAHQALTISVPAGDTNVGLIRTGVGAYGGFVPSDGVKSVVCTADDVATSFHLGFIVAGARCVPLSVSANGRSYTRNARFGVRRCPP